ncbi:unnamed protein product [Diatraea saccharalis]|uniref:Peptidase S1 domain-containing protein n=1 Tax=Diatraea saccharalis TaxID=40085 RepID=A0A9N9WJ60_9NEOP|nr:unnamed protein product [Diatraea saccharalis]
MISKLADPALRIRWGEDANVEEHPYIAALLYRYKKTNIVGRFKCTCTILKPIWALTAAHCVSIEGKKKIYFFIGYGTKLPTKNYSTSDVIETQKHPSFNKFNNDIALLKTEPIALSRYGKVSAADYTTLIGHAVLAFGYGIMQDGKNLSLAFKLGKPLQVTDMVIKKCASVHNKRSVNFPSVCLSPKCGKVNIMCSGDSGGPLIHPSGIVAVLSFGIEIYCHEYFIPDEGEKLISSGSYMPVSPYIDWISSIVKK